ncbi:MAG TPA: AprI/Inh family metalloprotease inhibitor [Caulobacteraceae bacterium]|nr:AprI/Inh family metalloprotease inhibitor [Caulobacteraceae bacterium]
MTLTKIACLGAAAALTLGAGAAQARVHEAGVPLSPAEAAGPWTLESGGHSICRVELFRRKAGSAGFAAHAPGGCAGALPSGVAGWTPTGDGMALTDDAGQVLLAFDRWSNSLFVSRLGSREDVQLQRGAGAG